MLHEILSIVENYSTVVISSQTLYHRITFVELLANYIRVRVIYLELFAKYY